MAPFAPPSDELNDQGSSPGDFPFAKDTITNAIDSLHMYDAPLTNFDKVMVMQGWSKVLAFKTAFSESLWIYWRILVATDTTLDTANQAVQCVERNKDPLAKCMLDRGTEAEGLLMGLIDGALRTLCPMQQIVQRESYRPIQDDLHLQRSKDDSLTLACETIDYLKLFARCGVQPEHWVLFCEAFIWCLQTHTPYAKDDDKEDIERGPDSAMARAIAQLIALPAIKAYKRMIDIGESPLYKEAIPGLWPRLNVDDRMDFGERFYRKLLMDHPILLDDFSKTDMDSLAAHFVGSLDLVVTAATKMASTTGKFRQISSNLANTAKPTTSRRVPIEGVCSHYLAELRPGVDRAKIKVVKSSFRLPEDKSSPLILVGAGTGVSPMMGFMEDRHLDRQDSHKVGDINLFFGCRTDDDFTCKDIITRYDSDSLLNLHSALSRVPNNGSKTYVQNRLADMGLAASELLMNKDTHYYVCGDARMSDSCFEACVELLRNHQMMSRVKAVKHLRDMHVEDHWQTDVWGVGYRFSLQRTAM